MVRRFPLLLLTLPLLIAAGCKNGGSNNPPTADQAKAFKGAPMSESDRAGMAKEQADAAAYRRAHPEQFPTETKSAAPQTK